jgi:3-phenylpropionate/trans-cinnamate dioxygenase ferredoxin component
VGEEQRVNLGDLSRLTDGDMDAVVADGTDVLVCRVQGTLYALEDLCSHADTTLSDGLLNGYKVVCPLHGAQFDVRTGEHSGPPAWCGVKAFAITEGPDGAVLDLTSAGDDGGDGSDGPQFQFRTR